MLNESFKSTRPGKLYISLLKVRQNCVELIYSSSKINFRLFEPFMRFQIFSGFFDCPIPSETQSQRPTFKWYIQLNNEVFKEPWKYILSEGAFIFSWEFFLMTSPYGSLCKFSQRNFYYCFTSVVTNAAIFTSLFAIIMF